MFQSVLCFIRKWLQVEVDVSVLCFIRKWLQVQCCVSYQKDGDEGFTIVPYRLFAIINYS